MDLSNLEVLVEAMETSSEALDRMYQSFADALSPSVRDWVHASSQAINTNPRVSYCVNCGEFVLNSPLCSQCQRLVDACYDA